MKSWIVYMLRCRNGSLYTGITNDLDKRLAAHAAGTGAKYTRSHGPVRLVWTESRHTESSARKREFALKRLKKAQKEALISAS